MFRQATDYKSRDEDSRHEEGGRNRTKDKWLRWIHEIDTRLPRGSCEFPTSPLDLAEILDKIGYVVRERFRILGQVKALTGEGRISGVVLMALPIALFFAVYYLNPQYVMLLFTEAIGRKMIAVAVVLQILGAITIKKIVNIKI